MVRLLAAILFTCCLTASLNAQAPQATQDAAKDGPPVQTADSPSEKAQFPLDAFPEFSAVMVGSMSPDDNRESFIYRSGKLLRNSGPEGRNFLITDLTTLQTYGVAATGCLHDSHPYIRSIPFSSIRPGVTVQRAAAGQETVDGHSCKIEDVTLKYPKLARPMKLRFWEAEDLQGFPVKVEFIRGFGRDPVIHYKNVVLGPQDPTLFIYPHTCEKSLGYDAKPPMPPAPGTKPKAPPAATPPN